VSAPSALHDARLHVLGDVAALAGFYIDLPFAQGERPDIVRLHHQRPSLLVGDAKATESPGCEATRARLTRYFRTGRKWSSAGFGVRVALCHGPVDPERWAILLCRAARDAQCRTGPVDAALFDSETTVTWVDLSGTNDVSHAVERRETMKQGSPSRASGQVQRPSTRRLAP
jgi:hypothetical protein